MIEVSHYGVHWDPDGIAFLHQGRSSANALGLAAKSPFFVKEARGRPCNHMMTNAAAVPDPLHWNRFQKLAEDPLVRAMLPVPKGAGEAGVYFVEDPNDELGLKLVLLSKMTSPISKVVRILWMTRHADIMSELERTNIQPLVLIRARLNDQKVVNDIIAAAPYAPRTVVITGAADLVIPAPAQRITTDLRSIDDREVAELPFENLGMMVLRRYMRREPLLADLPPPRKK